MRNGVDPDYVPSQAELVAIAQKIAAADTHLQERYGPDPESPESLGTHVLAIGTYREPNDYAHRNYCGPGATLVILSARLTRAQIYDLVLPNDSTPTTLELFDKIGSNEGIDPTWGVTNTKIRDELNRQLNTTYYSYVINTTKANLKTYIVYDIDEGYALNTSLWTGGMAGWGTRDTKHVVAIHGYNETTTSSFYVYYTETSQSVQGYSGLYKNVVGLTSFYQRVKAHENNNNSQVW